MNTKSKLISLLTSASFALAVLPTSSEATPITGTLDLTGVAQLDKASLATATGVVAFTGVRAAGASDGVFTDAGLARAPVTMKAFSWNPASTPVIPLWTFTYPVSGGTTFSFDLLSLTVDSQSANFLNLTGTGIMKSSAYDDTVGSWSFTISDADGQPNANFKFGFQSATATSATPVPDSGMTLSLLGGSMMILLAGVRKKLS